MNVNQQNVGYVQVYVICEGQTEQKFVNSILNEYLATNNIGLIGTLCDKRGGDVKFDRFALEIYNTLKRRPDVYATTFVDFYGISEKWPGKESAKRKNDVQSKSRVLCEQTKIAFQEKFALQSCDRFIPYFSMFEFEALLFSDAAILADVLKIDVDDIQKILDEYKSPEEINNSPTSAPSKRLESLTVKRYKKIGDGLKIAEKTGVDAIRKRCAVFDRWITTLEELRNAPSNVS